MKPLLLKGGRVIDPSQNHDDVVDLLIVDGKIEAMGNESIVFINCFVNILLNRH